MLRRGGMVFAALALVCIAGCASKEARHVEQPSPEEMRKALKELLAQRPEVSIPEFELSLERSPAIRTPSGKIQIGSFDIDLNSLMFEAFFSSPNLTLQQLTGRFEQDSRGNWHARLLASKIATANDPNRRADWFPSDDFSWSLGQNHRR
jgi:hypothetical protein